MDKCVSCLYITMKDEMNRMIKMLHYFHPEANVEVFGPEDWNNLTPEGRAYPYASIGLTLINRYDTITHIDADVFIVDKIDELLDNSTDVRAGRNNSDNNRAGPTPGFGLPNVPWTHYVNAGIHSISNPMFWEDWLNSCLENGHNIQFGEQGILNQLFYSGKYNSKLLDPIESNLHYGTSCMDGDGSNYWRNWKNIILVNDHLEINGKRIKMLHLAGGSCRKPNPDELFIRPVANFINDIINS